MWIFWEILSENRLSIESEKMMKRNSDDFKQGKEKIGGGREVEKRERERERDVKEERVRVVE